MQPMAASTSQHLFCGSGWSKAERPIGGIWLARRSASWAPPLSCGGLAEHRQRKWHILLARTSRIQLGLHRGASGGPMTALSNLVHIPSRFERRDLRFGKFTSAQHLERHLDDYVRVVCKICCTNSSLKGTKNGHFPNTTVYCLIRASFAWK